MGVKKAGGFIFKTRAADHTPFHVHIWDGHKWIGRWDIENQRPMDDFEVTQRLRQALADVGYLREKA